jgi:lipopolysaccharide biosynthesis glycosyltransferase
MDPFPYWIGYDAREKDAYDVCSFSCRRKSSVPLYVRALKAGEMRHAGIFSREWRVDGKTGRMHDVLDGKPFSTEFAFTRFLVPYLQGYKGWALFTDCDVLWLADIADLVSLRDDKYAAMVVKHDYNPVRAVKMDNQAQQSYPRKNWSSVILWNCAHPSNKALTPQVVNTQTGRFLHAFSWLKNDEIGELPEGWNYLVGHSSRKVKPQIMHFTDGGPWFEHMRNGPFAGWWTMEFDYMMGKEAKFQ